MKRYTTFLVWFLLCALAQPIYAEQDNKIWVYGKRKERYRRPHAGKSLKLKPAEPSRLFSDAHIKEDASLKPVETGKPSPSGFSLPKIRGQDQRLTEVWVEDTLIHDPWEGLPLGSELDLVAFGELSMMQGVSPADLMSLNPIGSLRYTFRLGKSSRKFGLSVGEPYGLNLYGKVFESWNSSSIHGNSGFYGRSYRSDGQYEFYQDHGNPYDRSSGSFEQRENNDQNSWQMMPYTSLKIGRHYLTFFGLFNKIKSGIPGYGSFLSLARQDQKGGLLSTSYTYEFLNQVSSIVPKSFRLGAYYRDDSVHTLDPAHPLLGVEVEEDRRTKVRRIDAGLNWEGNSLTVNSKFQAGESEIEARQNNSPMLEGKRSHLQGVLSSVLRPIDEFSIELKILSRLQSDYFTKKEEAYQDNEEPQTLKTNHRMQAYSLASSVKGDVFLAYVQGAFYLRPPTMVEEFGDGNRVMPSLSLSPEKIIHYEFGLDGQLFAKKLNLHLGAFSDSTEEKIAFVPALAYTYVAKNIEKTLIAGGEFIADMSLGQTSILASYTYLQPRIKSQHLEGRMVPGLSEHRFVMALNYYLNKFWNIRGRVNYRSESYRDVENSVIVPMNTTYDASTDYRIILAKKYDMNMGLSIVNLSDIKTMRVSSPYDTDRNGLIAYSDVDGYPLPGRQWIVHAHLDF